MSSSILLDTCILSYMRLPKKYPAVIEFVTTRKYVFASAATFFELSKGCFSESFVARPLSSDIRRFYADLLSRRVVTVIDTDRQIAELWGVLYALAASYPERNCSRYADRTGCCRSQRADRLGQDLHIAAAAIARGLPVATSNIRDFMEIHEFAPLPGLYDPLAAVWHVKPTETEAFRCSFGSGLKFELEPNEQGKGWSVPIVGN